MSARGRMASCALSGARSIAGSWHVLQRFSNTEGALVGTGRLAAGDLYRCLKRPTIPHSSRAFISFPHRVSNPAILRVSAG